MLLFFQLQLENPELDIKSVIDDRFMEALHEKVEGFGKIRFVKCINKMIWVAFMNHANALDVVNIGLVEVIYLFCSTYRIRTGSNFETPADLWSQFQHQFEAAQLENTSKERA